MKYLIVALFLVGCTKPQPPPKDQRLHFHAGDRVKISNAEDLYDGCQGTVTKVDSWYLSEDKTEYIPKLVLLKIKCPYVREKDVSYNWLIAPQDRLVLVK